MPVLRCDLAIACRQIPIIIFDRSHRILDTDTPYIKPIVSYRVRKCPTTQVRRNSILEEQPRRNSITELLQQHTERRNSLSDTQQTPERSKVEARRHELQSTASGHHMRTVSVEG